VESIVGVDVLPPQAPVSKLNFEQGDVRTASFEQLFAGVDAVYHLAFIVEPPKDMGMPEIDEINIEGSRRVFEGAAAAGVPRIIYSSSVAAYGAHPDNPPIFTEETPLRSNENWYYSRAKGRVEAVLDTFEKEHPDIIVIRFRPCIFVGPEINNTIRAIIDRKKVWAFGKDDKTDYCWDGDIVEAHWMALSYGKSDIFNLAADGPLSAEQIAELLNKKVLYLNYRMVAPLVKLLNRVGVLPQGAREWFEVGFSGPIIVSAEKAKEKLGWKPQYDAAGAIVELGKRTGVIP
jgi:UDP-glucose 4-epimerase